MNFDEVIDRRNTHSGKWDKMETIYGVSPDDGIAMWTADMEFKAPQCISDELQSMVDHGIYGYFGDVSDYHNAICNWMKTRHGWSVDPSWIFATHGLVNGTAMCVDTFTDPGDAIVLFSPVYYVFYREIEAAGRTVTEAPLVNNDGRYEMDFDAAEAALTGREKMVILCSPHNPGGRVWDVDELRQLAGFCVKHDLVLVSDEIHHDLVFPGAKHTIMSLAAPEIADRLIMLTAPTKTFNIAGSHTGNVIIEDEALRARFNGRMMGLGISPNSFGMHMTTAGYSEAGAEWLEALIPYLQENHRIFDEGMHKIPGVKSMPLSSTYLAWVDFSGTGMSKEEFTARAEKDAKIAGAHGDTFGAGGESYLRFTLACPRSVVVEVVERLQKAFADLQ